jgi:spore coat protein A
LSASALSHHGLSSGVFITNIAESDFRYTQAAEGAMTTLLNAQRQFDQYAFQNDLPIPEIIDGTNGGSITLGVWQTSQFLGLYDVHGDPLYTTVWGYGESAGDTTYPGPTILAYEGVPITVHWQNNLPLTGHLLPVDTSLHFAESTSLPLTDGFVPIVTHLHGGHNDSNFDGLPDQWFTQPGPNGLPDVGSKFFSSSMTSSARHTRPRQRCGSQRVLQREWQ